MPDFLNRLAARALGTLPLAEPLVPTHFAPIAQHVALSPFGFSPEASSEAVGAVLRQAHPSPPDSTFAPLDSGPGDRTESAQAARSQLEHVSFSQPEEMFRNEPQVVRIKAQSASIDAATFLQNSTRSEAGEAQPRNAGESLRARPLVAQPKAAFIAPVAVPSRFSGERSQARVSASSPALPIVRVNIGRIEVRAELPARAAAPVPPRSRSSHVSLEQFLKQAGGGTR